MKWFWVFNGKRVIFDEVDAYYRRVYLTNPEDLYDVSIAEMKDKLTGYFGNEDFSCWVAEEILIEAIRAVEDNQIIADFSDICSVKLLEGYDDSELKLFCDNKTFRNIFYNLPIFKIVSESEEEVILEYVAE